MNVCCIKMSVGSMNRMHIHTRATRYRNCREIEKKPGYEVARSRLSICEKVRPDITYMCTYVGLWETKNRQFMINERVSMIMDHSLSRRRSPRGEDHLCHDSFAALRANRHRVVNRPAPPLVILEISYSKTVFFSLMTKHSVQQHKTLSLYNIRETQFYLFFFFIFSIVFRLHFATK